MGVRVISEGQTDPVPLESRVGIWHHHYLGESVILYVLERISIRTD